MVKSQSVQTTKLLVDFNDRDIYNEAEQVINVEQRLNANIELSLIKEGQLVIAVDIDGCSVTGRFQRGDIIENGVNLGPW
jgi:hypothetical protein